MSISFEKKNDIGYLAVADEMTIYTAAEQRKVLLGYLVDHPELELDLSSVSEIDSAGIQLLMALKSEALRLNHELRFVRHSQPVIEVFELLRLSARFSDPIIIPSEWQTP